MIVEEILKYLPVRGTIAKSIVLLILPAIWIVPMALRTVQEAQERTIPLLEPVFSEWAGQALPAGTILMPDYNYSWRYLEYVFGYDGEMRPWVAERPDSRSLEEWAEMYVPYAYIAEFRHDFMTETEAGQAFFDEILLLKQFPAPSDVSTWRGDPFSIYYLGEVDERVDVNFGGEINLVGYTINAEEFSAGEQIYVQAFWQADVVPSTDYQVYVHLVPEDNRNPIAQFDGLPSLASYPPTKWTDPNEVIVGQEMSLTIPPETTEANYRILIGLYDVSNFARLTTNDGDDFYELGSIRIKAD